MRCFPPVMTVLLHSAVAYLQIQQQQQRGRCRPLSMLLGLNQPAACGRKPAAAPAHICSKASSFRTAAPAARIDKDG
jgi:hypothetical protein|eukprot:COSAG06_NODE_17849_length_918_cov_0.726496_2_plen_77_part_00